MNRKQIVISIIVVVALAGLAYLQVREWQKFDWEKFWAQTGNVSWVYILSAVGLIYATYLPRALRWKVFLRPVRHVAARELIAPTIIGFTGLALLGRPGELMRPYLIGRKTNLGMSTQMAVWTVERIFDTAAFAILMGVDLLTAPSLRDLHHFKLVRFAGLLVVGLVFVLTAFALAMRRYGQRAAAWVKRTLGAAAPTAAEKVAHKIRAFGEGLNTIHDAGCFVQIVGLSLLIWFMIALAYHQVVHAYPEPLQHLSVSHVVILLGFAIVGSSVQLPVVGGGAQMASIAALVHVFEMPNELAVSAGIMLWLVTFIAVTPLGLILAHREHVSLRRLSRESVAEQSGEAGG